MRTAVVRILAVVVLVAGLGWAAPVAGACACGAMEPADQRNLGVNSETAAILFDGQSETVALSMGLDTDSSDVAFLLPLPTKAELDVAGDDLFDQLHERTRPEVKVRYSYDLRFWLAGSGGPEGGAPVGGARVVGHQQVGDYDVVQLTGEASAVGDWLSDNGFRTRDEVIDGLGHYLEQGWVVMAVKLVFTSDEFSGGAAPLVVRFPTDQLVYPMRLSALATSSQSVRFYVFADHRQQVGIDGRSFDTTFAGWVDGDGLRAEGLDQAADLVGQRRWFLTRIDDQVLPDRITGDLEFAPAPEGDVEHREVIWRTEERGGLVVAGIVAVAVLVTAVGVVVSVVKHRRAQRRWRDAHAKPEGGTG